MRSRSDFVHLFVVPCCLLLLCIASGAAAQTTLGSAFSYQGQLRNNGNPMTATCDFQFKLYDAAVDGNQIGSTLKLGNVQVQNGLFNVELDFGRAAFSSTRWLEVTVGYPAGTTSTTTLAPRHKLVPTPYSLYAAGVADGAVTSSSLGTGAVTGTKIAPGAVTSSNIAPQAVTSALIAPQAVTNAALATGAVNGRTIADGSVATTHIVDYAITSVKIADSAVMTGHILDNAVTSNKIADLAVTNAKISSVAWNKITGAPATYPPGGTAGGALSGSYPNPALATNAVTSTAIAINAVTSNKIANVAWSKITGAPGAYPPIGAAGGALSGTYPNPALAANVVTSLTLANNAVTSRTIPDGSILDRKISSISWNKITGVPASLPPSGVAGGDLTGSYPNPVIANGAVTDDKINSLSWSKITGAPLTFPPNGLAGGDLTGAYPNPTIANGAVTDAKITSISWAKITGAPASYPPQGTAGGVLTGTYPNPALADNAITSPALADNAVTSRALARNAVTSTSIQNGAVTDDKIAGVSWSKVYGAPNTYSPSGTAGGDLTGAYPNPAIANGAITDAKITSISWSKISGAPTMYPPDGAAGGALTGTYPNPALADNAVTSPALADNAVTSRALARNAVTSTSIQNGAVTDDKIRSVEWSKVHDAPTSMPPDGSAGGALAGTYPNPTLAANAVTSSAIQFGAVTDDKINSLSWSKITGAPLTFPPNGLAGGDLTGVYPNPTIANGAVTDAKITSISWAKITGAPASYPPQGTAGGVLTGTYPNPLLASNAVTSPALANNAVTSRALARNAVTSTSIQNGAVTNEKILSVDWARVTGSPGSMPPSGPAGGVLAGFYPTPSLANGAITSAALATGAVDSSKITLPLFFEGTTPDASSAILTITDHGAGRAMDAMTYSDRSGIRGTAFGLNGFGIYGIADNGSSAKGVGGESQTGYGIYGTSLTGYGVGGSNTKTANFGYLGTVNEGAYGNAQAMNGTGVTGVSEIGTDGKGVAGLATDGCGVYGINQTSGNYGLLGTPTGGAEAYSVMDNALYAVTDVGTAIFGHAGPLGQAGLFEGNVQISGSLSITTSTSGGGADLNVAGSKNFRINHPLDPANKVLLHAAVEGPERMNIYNGNVVTNDQGLASVQLPAYFMALNADPRYQLTVIGQFAQAIIAEEIKDNRFTIRTDKPGVKVSWQVIGTRKDSYALAHPFIAEQPKKAPAQEGR